MLVLITNVNRRLDFKDNVETAVLPPRGRRYVSNTLSAIDLKVRSPVTNRQDHEDILNRRTLRQARSRRSPYFYSLSPLPFFPFFTSSLAPSP
ncbi:hypothetical protein PN499_10880 [Kamptonema animale CS-326]|nr:hypothetical protein [Kamptonema animale CS-326]